VSTWKDEVSKETGIPASLLHGSTKDEITAFAETLKPHLKETPKAPSSEGQGKQGKTVSDGDMSAEEIVKKAIGR
jgi:hypothetical protein